MNLCTRLCIFQYLEKSIVCSLMPALRSRLDLMNTFSRRPVYGMNTFEKNVVFEMVCCQIALANALKPVFEDVYCALLLESLPRTTTISDCSSAVDMACQ